MTTPHNRRAFLGSALALAGTRVTAAPRTPAFGSARQQTAYELRQQAALRDCREPAPSHPTNGDETSLPAYVGSFTKGLPHTQLGEVQPGTYETLLHALSTGKESDFEMLDRGSGAKFIDPLAAYAYQMEGADSHQLVTPPPPAFSSQSAAGEMIELYWQALARDVPFTNYATNQTIQAAATELKTAPASIFRGNFIGALDGPYISQFFWQPVPSVSTIVQQRYRSGAPGIDYLTSYDEWQVIQTGVPPFRSWTADPQERYIYNGRSLAEWVHYDFLYQAFHNAALILLNQGPETALNVNPYLNPTNPYKTTKVETGFATFGAPHICCILGTATQAALLAAWFQKWLVHRRTRPEEFGRRVHQTKLGKAQYPIHSDLLNSAPLKAAYAASGTYLLPQAFPEGCPLHPSYPSGHATVSGACSVMLKAFFDEREIVTNAVVASSAGLSLLPYTGDALTVGGEINKLAFNVAMGRNWAGIHYRSDAEAGLRLGEDVAIAILQDLVATYAEDFPGFQFTRLDGTLVSIPSIT